MTVETDIDRLDMLSDWETITKGANSWSGVFAHAYFEAENISGYAPVFTCRTSDVTLYTVAEGDTVTISSVNYTVIRLEADGQGITRLILEEV